MPQLEFLKLTFNGVEHRVQRRKAPITSSTLLAFPEAARPKPELACATCPAGSWYYDGETLACHCAARRYVSWVPSQKPILVCDDREAALADLDQPRAG